MFLLPQRSSSPSTAAPPVPSIPVQNRQDVWPFSHHPVPAPVRVNPLPFSFEAPRITLLDSDSDYDLHYYPLSTSHTNPPACSQNGLWRWPYLPQRLPLTHNAERSSTSTRTGATGAPTTSRHSPLAHVLVERRCWRSRRWTFVLGGSSCHAARRRFIRQYLRITDDLRNRCRLPVAALDGGLGVCLGILQFGGPGEHWGEPVVHGDAGGGSGGSKWKEDEVYRKEWTHSYPSRPGFTNDFSVNEEEDEEKAVDFQNVKGKGKEVISLDLIVSREKRGATDDPIVLDLDDSSTSPSLSPVSVSAPAPPPSKPQNFIICTSYMSSLYLTSSGTSSLAPEEEKSRREV